MILKESVYVRLRLLIDPKLFDYEKFSFSITYTTFAVKKKGGAIVNNKTQTLNNQSFSRNPDRNDHKGLIALDTEPFWLYKYAKDDESILENLNIKRGMGVFSITYKGANVTTQPFKPEWMLKSENSISTYVWKVTTSTNSTKPNTQKKANINPYPFIIAKSENYLFDVDSTFSKGQKLDSRFYTRNGALYTMSKDELFKELLNLMEWGSTDVNIINPEVTGKNEVVAKDLATKFVNNKSYSMSNTYTHPNLVNAIIKSQEFKNYVEARSEQIREAIKANNFKITPNQLLIKDPIRRLYFNGGKNYQNYWATGLGITLHQISYIEVELNSVNYEVKKPKTLNTTFILYDTFGLDPADLDKYGLLDGRSLEDWKAFGNRTFLGMGISSTLGWGFNCWWALQFHHNCIPVLVKLRIENVEISI